MTSIDQIIKNRNLEEVNENYGDCTCPKLKRRNYVDDTVVIKDDELMTENDEGWGFVVGPKFGCIHWTALDKPT